MQNREQCAMPHIIFIIHYFQTSIISHQHSFSPCSKLRLRYITLACTTLCPHIVCITNSQLLPKCYIICGRPKKCTYCMSCAHPAFS